MKIDLPKKVILSILSTIVLLGGTYGSYYVYTKESYKNSYPDFKVKKYEYVKDIVDGNTVILNDGTIVDIIGLNSPNINECYYNESRSALKNLIENKILKILKYQPKTDMFDGNLVEIVIASGDFAEDNTNASKFMIENGFAKLKPTDNDYIFDELTYLEQNAKLGKIGLWGKCR